MKRLLTYLGLLATLLAMPYYAKADNMYLHFWGGYAPTGNVEMGGTGSNTWSYTFSTADCTSQTVNVLPVANNNVYMKAYGNETYSGLGDGSEVWCWRESDDNIYDVSITLPSDWGTKNYNVTISATDYDSDRYGIKLTITWAEATPTEESITLRTDAYKRDNNVDWIGIRYNEFDSDNDTYIWYLSSIDGFNDGSKFKLELNNNWYGNGETVGSTFVTLGTGEYNCIPTIPTTTGNQVVRLEAKKVSGSWQARIVAGDGAHDYYWVSPQITNGEKWPSFKMVPSRNRYWDGNHVIGDGLMSTKYYTFTIKDDDLVTWKSKSAIGTGTQIQWYILRDDGQVVYRPTDDLYAGFKPNNNVDYDTNHPISGQLDTYVSFINFWNGSNYDGTTAYKTSSEPYNTGSWSFSKGSAKAHTFNLNVDRGHVLYNYTTTGASDANGYKLAGNWSAGREVSIDINQAQLMTPYYYKDGVGSTSYEAESDSIVYKISVDRPEAGWGGLYLDVLPASNADWSHAIRPLITLGNSLDGRALHGAMTTASSDQSLNPEASPNYLGYTFSFNATTMTYRLEFHTPDATLSPGTEDGNVDFSSTTSEDITVELSDESDGIHTTATQYAIGFADNTYFTLDETTKYSAATFNLTYDGENDRITYTSPDNSYTNTVAGNTIFVKVRGFDANGDYGDIHTYQYTFHSVIGFEPQGGLFINSAKITITGGTAPYTYQVMNYPTKEENGEWVIDFEHGTEITSGSFTSKTDELNRISTPGFLKITDAHDNTVVAAEVGGGFDFTYSTSENYDINKNGADYWTAAPGDLSIKLDPTWGITGGLDDETSTRDWAGNVPKKVNANQVLTQTIQGLNAGKTYTVQAIVGGQGEGKKTVTLTLEGAETVTKTINLRNGGSESSADLSRQGSEITRTGRVEYIEPSNLTGMNKYDGADAGGWAKVEATVNASQAGWLTISLTGDEWFDLSQVTLLEDANTTHGFRTTASATATEVGTGSGKPYDYRARNIQSGWKQNNAYSFFDRGKNRNAVIFANNRTVIAMDKSLLAPECPNRDIDRRHPFNVVGSDEDDSTDGVAKALYLTDMGYGSDENNPVDYKIGTKGADGFNSSGYKDSGYTFMPIYGFLAENVILDRTPGVSEKEQTTIMLPFAITVSELKQYYGNALQVWDYTGFDLNTRKVSLTEVANNLIANKPYMLTGANGTLDSRNVAAYRNKERRIAPVSYTLHHSANTSHSGFSGTYEYITVSREDENKTETHYGFRATEGTFTIASESGAKLKPFRAYFTLPMSYAQLKEKLGIAESRTFSIVFDADATTGITQTEEVRLAPANVYNINGVLMNSVGNLEGLPKGIYIMNGKKFVVK